MTDEEFDAANQAFRRRTPFRPYLIEFVSGGDLSIVHPESIRKEERLYVARRPDGGFELFTAEGVSRVIDIRNS